jgi:hypothetical protein
MEYRFYLQAGRATSGPESIARSARECAALFFGDMKFEVVCSVQGKPENFTVECVAHAVIDPEGV